jgi:hypothetical protein
VGDYQIILDEVLDEQRQAVAPGLSVATYFEVFTVPKDHDLSYEEIRSGRSRGCSHALL